MSNVLLNRRKNQPRIKLRRRVKGSDWAAFGFNNRAQSAGLRVSEFMAEKNVATAIVTANCLKNSPVIPLMNAHGTNTAISTREIAMIGDATSSIAFRAAS